MNRRDWLSSTSVPAFAFLGELLRMRRANAANPTPSAAGSSPGFGRAKSVIVVFANGGQSQLESWDPKPDAPVEVRGAFGAIPTSVPGTIVSDRLPQLAKLTDRYSIVRTMSHEDLDHGSAFYLAMTGLITSGYRRIRCQSPPTIHSLALFLNECDRLRSSSTRR